MKKATNRLGKQLILIFIASFVVVLFVIGGIIPTVIKNRFEKTIYEQLEEQLGDVDTNIENHTNVSDIYYVYYEDSIYYMSPNVYEIFSEDEVISLITNLGDVYGQFRYKNKMYYYYKIEVDDTIKISFEDGTSILNAENAIIKLAIYILLVVYLGVLLIVSLWSRGVVKRIGRLKEKIDNIDNPDYQFTPNLKFNDELRSLDLAIDDMHVSLLKQEELKTQLYQNISHDFKTPLTVIKSYIEAVQDGIEDKDKAFDVILEQVNKLETKVHSLLYLNKLDYLKDEETDLTHEVDIKKVIDDAISKFKHHNDNVKIITSIDKSKFFGTEDIWETVIDNILNNFYRYAEKCIKITVKNNKIVLYNDGPNIKEDFIDVMFIPYRKGIKGEFGLGLSIVKKSLVMMGYDIEVENHKKKGVSFIITKKGP